MKTNNGFTKEENRLISMMLIGGIAISIISIIPIGEFDGEVSFIMIIANIFYWALTIIMINSTLHNVLARKIEGSQSHDSEMLK